MSVAMSGRLLMFIPWVIRFESIGPARLFAQVRWNELLELFGKAKKDVHQCLAPTFSC
jgi:hypothetical protein